MIVSEYRITRHYGGPEEGGWWYDRRQFVSQATPDLDKDTALSVVRELNRRVREERGNRQDNRSRVNDVDGDLSFIMEKLPGGTDDTNDPRPHYE